MHSCAGVFWRGCPLSLQYIFFNQWVYSPDKPFSKCALQQRASGHLLQVSPSFFAWAERWLSSIWFAAIIILSFVCFDLFSLEEATSHRAVFLKVMSVEPWSFLRPKNYLHNNTKTSLPFSLLLTFELKVAGNAGLPRRGGTKQHLSVNASISLKLLILM